MLILLLHQKSLYVESMKSWISLVGSQTDKVYDSLNMYWAVKPKIWNIQLLLNENLKKWIGWFPNLKASDT